MEDDTLGSKVKGLIGKLRPRNKESKIQWKKLLMTFSIMVILGGSGFLIYESGFSYEVELNGSNIGFIKDEETLEETLDIVEKDVINQYGEDAYFIQETEVERVRGHNKELVELEELRQVISQEIEVLKPASIIVIDGKEQIIVDSEERAKAILEEIKKTYIKDKEEDIEIVEVAFNQDVEIISKDVGVDLIVSEKEALFALGTKETRNKINKVSRGNTRQGISRFSNVDINELEQVNPEENNIKFSEILLDVVSVERQKSKASMDFKIEEKDDSSIYKDEKKLGQEGKKGEKEILTEVTYINGVEREREVIKETIIEEPQNEIILVGTKERPEVIKTQPATKTQVVSKNTPKPTKHNNSGSSIVATASKYLGTPYKYGGNTPGGFDCSGFTSYVYKQCGINIPRTSGGQGSYGNHIPRNQLEPGDIVSFPGHVGIYVGSGNFIHSPSTGKTVEIQSLNSYRGPFLGGRRP